MSNAFHNSTNSNSTKFKWAKKWNENVLKCNWEIYFGNWKAWDWRTRLPREWEKKVMFSLKTLKECWRDFDKKNDRWLHIGTLAKRIKWKMSGKKGHDNRFADEKLSVYWNVRTSFRCQFGRLKTLPAISTDNWFFQTELFHHLLANKVFIFISSFQKSITWDAQVPNHFNALWHLFSHLMYLCVSVLYYAHQFYNISIYVLCIKNSKYKIDVYLSCGLSIFRYAFQFNFTVFSCHHIISLQYFRWIRWF